MIYGWSSGLPGVAGCGPGYGLRSRDSRLRSGLLSFVITISWVGWVGAYVPSYPGLC